MKAADDTMGRQRCVRRDRKASVWQSADIARSH